MIDNQIISAGYDDKIKYWTFNDNNKKLKQEFEFDVNDLEPRCITFNHESKQIFVGTKKSNYCN